MASIKNISECYDLSPNQVRLFTRLRKGRVVTPTGQEKRSMRVLVECELAVEKTDQKGSFVLAEGGQPMSHFLRQSELLEEIKPGVFVFKGQAPE